MITLKEALKLTTKSDSELVYIQKQGAAAHDGMIYTVKEIKNKFDMKHTYVTFIQPHFSCYDYSGYMELTIK